MPTRTIQMTIDAELLAEVDDATHELDMSRSALIRAALTDYLQRVKQRRLMLQDREAYERVPATEDDSDFWESVQDWGGQ